MKYYVLESQRPGDATLFTAKSSYLDSVAEEAAEHYHDRGGWEAKWPLTFVLLTGDGIEEMGRFTVTRDSQPVFRATAGITHGIVPVVVFGIPRRFRQSRLVDDD